MDALSEMVALRQSAHFALSTRVSSPNTYGSEFDKGYTEALMKVVLDLDEAIGACDETSGAKTLIVLVEDKSEYERLVKEAQVAKVAARRRLTPGYKPGARDGG